MFRGDHPDLNRTIGRALRLALELGHPRTGSEHLLAALAAGPLAADPVAGSSSAHNPPSAGPLADRAAAGSPSSDAPAGGTVAAALLRHGATPSAIRHAAHLAAPLGAGGAADRAVLAPLGVDLDQLLGGTPALDRPPGREPLLPLGAAKARRRCADLTPPLGLDAQAAYSASLRLALARREREHRPEHLALALTALDPGVAWVLKTAGVDREALLADLAATFPPPRRNPLLTVERRLGHRVRHRDLVRRYQRTTGRAVTSADALPALIRG
ncbi:Clp protease N-terminal domain-containing protein [Saccharothrix luteola]|uniref:Clp protease N-terminal domain-containing protein n=1 Tax=Saccharothrix luteola TaxID=2893018 RepID=UPI0027E21CA2|nr:Clp protease N-terminal domain-containing protein [Saccharothrix luteola]